MKHTRLILLCCFALMLFTSACEYDFPLAAKQGISIDNSVVGTWERGETRIKISRYSPTEYQIDFFSDDKAVVRGYPIKVAGKELVQLAAIEKGKATKYFVVSYKLRRDELTIEALAPQTKAKNSLEFRKFFVTNETNTKLFAEFGRFRKATTNSTTNGNHITTTQKQLDFTLWNATKRGDAVEVRNLLEKGANPNIRNVEGDTLLMMASEYGYLPIVQALLKKGSKVNAKNNDEGTALMAAARGGSHDVIKQLIFNGAEIEAESKNGITALIAATQQGHFSAVKALLDGGADPNKKGSKGVNDQGFTALHAAVFNSKKDVINLLISRRANVDVRDDRGVTPLMLAVLLDKLTVVPTLLNSGADIDAKDHSDRTALIFALIQKNPDAVRLLLMKGADVEKTFRERGQTPLMFATTVGHLPTVQALLAGRANVNAKTKTGMTALMTASTNNDLSIVRALLAGGADVNAENNDGVTALDLASYQGHIKVAEVLRQAQSKVSNRSSETAAWCPRSGEAMCRAYIYI